MLFAHLKRILRLNRLRLRGPCGARDEFLLAATAQNLRKMARLIPLQIAPAPARRPEASRTPSQPDHAAVLSRQPADFFNCIDS